MRYNKEENPQLLEGNVTRKTNKEGGVDTMLHGVSFYYVEREARTIANDVRSMTKHE